MIINVECLYQSHQHGFQDTGKYLFWAGKSCHAQKKNFRCSRNYANDCMIENSQKWYILDQHWWLVCFLIFCVWFILESRMFMIHYKSKYTSDMFYDWNFLEMVHPASALMTGMFSCILCMFYWSKEHPHMFFHIKILLKKLHFTRIFQLW